MVSDNLQGNLKKEYNSYYTDKKIFFKYYKGNSIQEFNNLPEIIYNEWSYWKNVYNKRIFEPVEKDTFDEYFQDFKDYWQYNTPETQKVFEEMKLLSESLINEWREKYTFKSSYEYEGYKSYISRDYISKTKAQLWKEFKTIWDLNPENYSEHKFNKYNEYINDCDCDGDTKYSKEYPSTFWEFRENANYHSFDSYSVLKQYMVCKEYYDDI